MFLLPGHNDKPHTRWALTAVVLACGTACAQGVAPSAAATGTLPEVQVRSAGEESATGPVTGYRARRATSATKTDTPLSETPQSVTVITRDQIVDQGAYNLQEALNYAAGVRSDAYGLDSRSDGVRVRGSTPDEYLDGLRKSNGYYTSTGRTDPYTLERIEVLRGPSAMLFGQGSTAGVINMVSKLPQAERQNEIGIQVGNYGRKQVQADLTGPLTADGDWLYRLVAVVRDSDTQVDHVRNDRTLIAPSLTWRPNGVTSLTLQALYQKDKSGSTSQFLPWSGTLLSNPNGEIGSSTFIGGANDHYDTERKTLGYLFEHRFDNGLSFHQNLRLSQNKVDYLSTYADASTGYLDTAQRVLGRNTYYEKTTVDAAVLDQHLQGKFSTGALQHQAIVGIDLSRYKTRQASGYDAASSIDVYNPVITNIAAPALFAYPVNTLDQAGLYVQDQMRHGAWTVVAGLRHDQVTNKTEGSDDQKDSANSKRLGLMYALGKGWSPYVSYSESFTPQSNANGQSFKPLRGEQYEAGIKYEPAGRTMAFNAAVYDLKEKNRINNPLPGVYNQLGETRTKGVELEARGSVTSRLDVTAHYNYTDLDRQLEGLPRSQAALWARYRFAIAGHQGFTGGAGVRWMGKFTDYSSGTGPEVPSVALVDALLSYDTAQWRYSLNITNLADKRYFSTCLSRGDCWYGARRTVVASATYRF